MKIILIDDDPLVRSSLKTILTHKGIEVAAAGEDGEDALPLYEKYLPDVALLDIRMKNVTGIDGGERILQRFPGAKILYLTTFSDDEYIVRALKMGAKGYLLKQDFESIVPALEAVVNGHRVFGDDVIGKLPLAPKCENLAKYGVTEKEAELIRLVADGLSNREIASQLFLSEGTVRNYLSSVLEKLELRDRTQLAIFYYKHLN